MFTKNIKFKNFITKKKSKNIKILRNFIKNKSLLKNYPLLHSLTNKFEYSFKKRKKLNPLKNTKKLI